MLVERRLSFTKLRAYEWLLNIRKLDRLELTHGEEFNDPDFVYHGTHGYEVVLLHGHNIQFERKRYRALLNWGNQCELLIFQENGEEPYLIIPFGKLPYNSGQYNQEIIITFRDTNPHRGMIACSYQEKNELERIRALIETGTFQQGDWADMLLQAMYCVLSDQLLVQSVRAKRYGTRFWDIECPHCHTSNQLDSKPKLYWLIKCKFCQREFVAKRQVLPTD